MNESKLEVNVLISRRVDDEYFSSPSSYLSSLFSLSTPHFLRSSLELKQSFTRFSKWNFSFSILKS